MKYPQLLYFRNQEEFVARENHEINNALRIKIKTDDVLFIMVRALDQETAEPFSATEYDRLQRGTKVDCQRNGR